MVMNKRLPCGDDKPHESFLNRRLRRIVTTMMSCFSRSLAVIACVSSLDFILVPWCLAQSFDPSLDPASSSEQVTIQVKNADISQVLNAFSLQTGRSVVIGPEVQGMVNMRLQDVPWKEALDVVLRPYGYGYQVMGETIIVNSMEKISQSETIEPVVSHVFQLKFLNARDIIEIVESQLSPRGHASVVTVRGQKGWDFESSSGGRIAQGEGSASKRRRAGAEHELEISKTLIVADIPSIISRVEVLLDQIDRMPEQVLIEATFVEVNSDFLKDLGVEFGSGTDVAESPGVQSVNVRQGDELFGVGVKQASGAASPASFLAQSLGVSETQPFSTGLSLLFQRLNDTQFEILLHMLQEDVSANVLSSPSILTVNNQEAAIVVGTKFPIISSDTSGESATISTTLEYYENIGIQLNVVPQICNSKYINMVVHPAVTDQIGTAAARTGAEGNIPLTEYPILSTREAETQVLIESGQRIVIGGLLEDRETKTELKVPFLGDIPILGRLFRRETESTAQTDLLIILSATIVRSEDMVTEKGRIARSGDDTTSWVQPSTQPLEPTPSPAPSHHPSDPGRFGVPDEEIDDSFRPIPPLSSDWIEPMAAVPMQESDPTKPASLAPHAQELAVFGEGLVKTGF